MSTPPLSTDAAPWHAGEKALFRFALLYFISYAFPYPFARFTLFPQWMGRAYEMKESIAHSVGVQLSLLPDQPIVRGAGDRAVDYVALVLELAIALVGAAVWSWIDRWRPHYRSLAYWATVALRYYVAYIMLEYGIIKILKSQFPFPGPIWLATPLGELTPMRVLWMFMGISTPYCVFIGICEFLGAFLLFFRRTVLTGALLSFAVLVNVLLTNTFFGVGLKLWSGHLLLFTSVLILPEARRIADALLGRAVPAREWPRPSLSPRLTRALGAIKLVVVSGLLLHAIDYGYGAWYAYGDAAPKPPLYGIWDVERFARNGEPVPADGSDPSRWRWLAVDSENRGLLQRAEGKPISIKVETNSSARRFELQLEPASSTRVALHYSEPEATVLELDGEIGGAPTLIRLKQRPLEQYPLVKHRLRWTSDL